MPDYPPAVTGHATEMSAGGMHVWNEEDYITEIYPTKVWVRKIIVVEDWTEVPRG